MGRYAGGGFWAASKNRPSCDSACDDIRALSKKAANVLYSGRPFAGQMPSILASIQAGFFFYCARDPGTPRKNVSGGSSSSNSSNSS